MPLRRACALSSTLAAFGAASLALPVQAQPAGPPAAAAAASAPRAGTGRDAPARLTVIEDDNVRIEETRLRGLPQRIVVHDKHGLARAYEIQVAPGGRDLGGERGASGQRAWSLFSF